MYTQCVCLYVYVDLLPASIVPKYLVSEWSYAQVRGLEGKAICAFDRDAPRIIVSCCDHACIHTYIGVVV